MTIQIYDSLTRQKKPLQPLTPGQIGMYVCGPTVYSDCHIGHTMGPVLFDAVARWLRVRGYVVRFVNNITDIDDKIIDKAKASGEAWQDITRRYTTQYHQLLQDLHVTTITDHPKCTDFIPQMVAYIEDLIAAGKAYSAVDGVYFDVQAKADYGKLSGQDLSDMRSDSNSGKTRHAADFALWKLAKAGEPSWPSPWGDGRPGWHIECSVMASDLLGKRFDIHGGGEDLKFPHHENEIAQAEAHGDGYACCWMHNGLSQYEGKKISKSDPRMRDFTFSRQFQALWLIETYGGEAVRFHILRGHYRRPQEFKAEQLAGTKTTLERLRSQLAAGLGVDDLPLQELNEIQALPLPEPARLLLDRFCQSMDDDFNTGAAIAQLFPLAALARGSDGDERTAILRATYSLAGLLGLFAGGLQAPAAADARSGGGDDRLAAVMELVLQLRTEARGKRDFSTADKIREALSAVGITLTDTAEGTRWE